MSLHHCEIVRITFKVIQFEHSIRNSGARHRYVVSSWVFVTCVAFLPRDAL